MNKIYKIVPVLMASVFVLGACGKDEQPTSAQLTVIKESEMNQELVKKLKIQVKQHANVFASILSVHPESKFMEMPLKSESEGGIIDESREDYFARVFNNIVFNKGNAESSVHNITNEHIKNSKLIEEKGLKMDYSRLDFGEMKISQHGKNLLVEVPMSARYIDKKTGANTYFNYQLQMVYTETEKGFIDLIVMTFEEGTNKLGEGLLTKSAMIEYAKAALESGIENASGYHYQDVESIATALEMYTTSKDVKLAFVEAFDIKKGIEKISFKYEDIQVKDERNTDGEKDYTVKFDVSGVIEITTLIEGKEIKEMYNFNLEIKNWAEKDFVSYHYNISNLKLKKTND